MHKGGFVLFWRIDSEPWFIGRWNQLFFLYWCLLRISISFDLTIDDALQLKIWFCVLCRDNWSERTLHFRCRNSEKPMLAGGVQLIRKGGFVCFWRMEIEPWFIGSWNKLFFLDWCLLRTSNPMCTRLYGIWSSSDFEFISFDLNAVQLSYNTVSGMTRDKSQEFGISFHLDINTPRFNKGFLLLKRMTNVYSPSSLL